MLVYYSFVDLCVYVCVFVCVCVYACVCVCVCVYVCMCERERESGAKHLYTQGMLAWSTGGICDCSLLSKCVV